MTDAALAAQTLLWEWASERDDPDPEQRAWKVIYCEGLLDACEHTGLLSAEEAGEWRRILADGGAPPPARGNREAAERHLDARLAAVPPMSRNPEPDVLSKSRRFHGALAALHAGGILSDEEEREWRSRGLATEGPWLDPDDIAQLSGFDGVYAISIPPTSPEEEAADAEAVREMDAVARRGRAKRVFVPTRLQRHDGLAIVAVVTRTDSTEAVFHHVGGPQGDVTSGRASLEAFETTVNGLVAPSLSDDAGTVYEPVSERPVGSHGTGGTPDPMRPRVITGTWRYQPPASELVNAFDVVVGAARWHLTRRGG